MICRRLRALIIAALPVLPAVASAATDTDLRLVRAAKQDDEQRVRELLKEHVDINAAEADGTTALIWAAYNDNRSLVQFLIASGANVNAQTDLGITPLSLACTNLDSALVNDLLMKGANPNVRNRKGETPLMTAARVGDTESVKSLLRAKTDVTAAEQLLGQTALMWAASEGHADIVRLLVAAHSNIRARSTRGWTPLLFAAANGDLETVQALVEAGSPVDEPAPDGSTALMIAADGGAWPADFQYWVPGQRGNEPTAHEKVGIFLLDRGAKPTVYDPPGRTPLHAATRTGKIHLARALLSHGANPNAHMVSNWPRLPGTLSDWSQFDFSGATAFLAAAKVPDLEMMKVLVAGGVDPNIPTFDGTTALMLVAGIGRVEGGVTRLVPDEILIPAAEYVIGLGNDINAVNLHGMTAVHGAAANGSDGVIRLLADKGAILDVKDRDGHTPIDLAEGLWSNFSILVHKSSADLLRKFTNR